jgi:hypothetical protein
MDEEKKAGVDRRAFLKSTALGAAVAVAPAQAGAQSQEPAPKEGGAKPKKDKKSFPATS